ncbi:unnamed protein product [Allacma fusca]|uniref:SEC14-like protein 2 n=1 Tax=Allacma fusca TaxID=39272 RepID=A0A8J2NQM2_9HEXA|nr:unnamed protein product [Allacma fusca]
MSELTESQLVALEQFRKKVDDVLTEEQRLSEAFLLRWLIAREFDVAKAEAMIRSNVVWRKENDVEEVLRWEAPEVFRLYYTIGITGFDNENSPVVIVPFGRMDLYGIIAAGGKENFIKFTLQNLENCLFRMKGKKNPKNGKEVTRLVVIFDCENFSLRTLSYSGVVDTILDLIRQYEANYPETLKAAYVVNAPRVFMILYGMIKPLLSAHTLGKVQIFGNEPQKWKKAVLTGIPSNQLPKHWGGTKEGNDEYCSNTVCMGGTVPTKYYANGQVSTDGSDDITLTVGAGSKFEMDLDIAVPNSSLKWNFKTDGYDIGFSVKFENKEVVPYRRVDSHKTREEGSITCDRTGIYQLSFDNTYSRLRSKTLHYFVTILSSDGIVIEEEDVDTSL